MACRRAALWPKIGTNGRQVFRLFSTNGRQACCLTRKKSISCTQENELRATTSGGTAAIPFRGRYAKYTSLWLPRACTASATSAKRQACITHIRLVDRKCKTSQTPKGRKCTTSQNLGDRKCKTSQEPRARKCKTSQKTRAKRCKTS